LPDEMGWGGTRVSSLVSWAQFYMPLFQGQCNNFTNLGRINQCEQTYSLK